MEKLLLVFVGGGIGSSLRYGVGRLVARATPRGAEDPHWLAMIPVATLLVNVVGCAAIGVVWGAVWGAAPGRGQDTAPAWAVFVVTGVLGGFTTFSAFGWETLAMVQDGRAPAAIAYALASVGLGLLGAWIGFGAGSSFFG